MLELYKGQIDIDVLKNIPYREALLLKESRIKRLEKEKEEIEKERAQEAEKLRREQARNSILRK